MKVLVDGICYLLAIAIAIYGVCSIVHSVSSYNYDVTKREDEDEDK